MRTKIDHLIIVTIFAGLLAACEKNIDIDIDEIEPMIVMNGVLTEGEDVRLYLSRTRHILDNMPITSLTNATVEISDEEGNTDTLIYSADQSYTSSKMTIESGRTYTVNASALGYNSISAVNTIPGNISIVRVDTASSVNEWGERMIDFSVVFDDPGDVENYYMLSVRTYYEISRIEYDYHFDTLYVDPEKDTVVTGYRRDTLEFITVHNEHLWFESENLAIENEDSYGSRIIFSDRLFDGKRYSLTGRFSPWFLWDAKDSATIYISLQTIDDHYFKYIDSRSDHYYAKNDPFAVPVVVHNNIENGVGILGGMSVDTDSFKVASQFRKDDYPIYDDRISGN